MEVKVDGSPESLVIEKVNDSSMRATLKSPTGEKELGLFPLQQGQGKSSGAAKALKQYKQNQKQVIPGVEEGCTAARRTCAGSAAIAGIAGALALIPNPISTPVLGAVAAGAASFAFGCWMMFGGALPLSKLIKEKLSIIYDENLGKFGGKSYDFLAGFRALSE